MLSKNFLNELTYPRERELLHLYILKASLMYTLPVIIIDGGGYFDPYTLSLLCRKAGLGPQGVLESLIVSRAFTCHQMHTLIKEELPLIIEKTGAGRVFILGLLNTFYDEAISEKEALELLNDTVAAMKKTLKRRIRVHIHIIEEAYSGKRSYFFNILRKSRCGFIKLHKEQGSYHITDL